MSLARGLLRAMDRTGAVAALERVFGCGGIVGYHAVTPEALLPAIHVAAPAFEEQVEFLAARYSVIPLRKFVARRRAGRSLRGCVAITFDDAYTSVLELALPRLERLGLPATVFVVSGYASSGRPFWWDRLGWVWQHADQEAARRAVAALTGSPDTPEDQFLRGVLLQSGGRLSPDGEAALTGIERTIAPVPLRPLDEAGLLRLAQSSLIDFGCHTESHPGLPYLSREQQRIELATCMQWLRDRLPRVLPYVAFPYGLYSRETVLALQEAGLEAGFSLTGRAATSRCDLLCCPRVGLSEGYSIASLRAHLNWAAIPLIALRHREWHARVPGLSPQHGPAAAGR